MKIEKRITKVSVKNLENFSETFSKTFSKLPREDILFGSSYKLKVPIATYSLYMTINNQQIGDKLQPFEVFIDSKNQELFQFQRVVSITLSAFLRTGTDINFLLEEYSQIQDPNGGFYFKFNFISDKSIYYPSLIALVAAILKTHIEKSSC
jgi:hypothetical protein